MNSLVNADVFSRLANNPSLNWQDFVYDCVTEHGLETADAPSHDSCSTAVSGIPKVYRLFKHFWHVKPSNQPVLLLDLVKSTIKKAELPLHNKAGSPHR